MENPLDDFFHGMKHATAMIQKIRIETPIAAPVTTLHPQHRANARAIGMRTGPKCTDMKVQYCDGTSRFTGKIHHITS
jgi:hypothetical protein